MLLVQNAPVPDQRNQPATCVRFSLPRSLLCLLRSPFPCSCPRRFPTALPCRKLFICSSKLTVPFCSAPLPESPLMSPPFVASARFVQSLCSSSATSLSLPLIGRSSSRSSKQFAPAPE